VLIHREYRAAALPGSGIMNLKGEKGEEYLHPAHTWQHYPVLYITKKAKGGTHDVMNPMNYRSPKRSFKRRR
jgi:hypothetical protein